MGEQTRFDVEILHEDDHLVALAKPAGIAMHGGTGIPNEESLIEAVLGNFEIEEGFQGPAFLGRLDRQTSGLVLLALSQEGLNAVNRAYRENHIVKDYLCVVHGRTEKHAHIRAPLPSRKEAKKKELEECHTEYETLLRGERVSVLAVRLHTGRQHQIRRHMKAIGHPVIADPRYGHRRKDEKLSRQARKNGMLLHSWRMHHELDISLPRELEARIPQRFEKAMLACGIDLSEVMLPVPRLLGEEDTSK